MQSHIQKNPRYVPENPKYSDFFQKINSRDGAVRARDILAHPIKSAAYLFFKKIEIDPRPLSQQPGGVQKMVMEQLEKSGLLAKETFVRFEITADIMRKAYDFPNDSVVTNALSEIFRFASRKNMRPLKIGIREFHSPIKGSVPVVELIVEFDGFGDRIPKLVEELAIIDLFYAFAKNERAQFLERDDFKTSAVIVGHYDNVLVLQLTSLYLSEQAKLERLGKGKGMEHQPFEDGAKLSA